MSRAGANCVIFNRSHYEGVLIERVHGLISQKACRRRYEQIVDFERLLSKAAQRS